MTKEPAYINSYYKHLKTLMKRELFLDAGYKTLKINPRFFVKGGQHKKQPIATFKKEEQPLI